MSAFNAEGEISKVDADKRQVFGWASVTDLDGEPVTDRQNDWIAAEELEKAVYDYVLSSRIGGTMHQRVGKSQPKTTSKMIESFVVTPEKIEKMGLPPGSVPTGWWTGFQVEDSETWDKVKKGQLTSFSIHGSGKRTQVDKTDLTKSYEQKLVKVWKFADSDPVWFLKGIAHLADEAHDRNHSDAHFYEQVLKHLIGSHEQKDHDPTKGKGHSREQHEGLTRQFHGLPGSPGEGNGLIAQGMKEFDVSEKELAEMFAESGSQDLDDLRAWMKNKGKKRTSKRLGDREKQILVKYMTS